MTFEILFALASFCLVSSISPGPNNVMLLASGANYGFRKSVPHLLGVSLGFTFMVIVVGAGLMQVFETFPIAGKVLKTVSVVYLIYLAWQIANASPPESVDGATKPLTFLQAALFQWVNPKAWTMAITALSVYSPGRGWLDVLVVAIVYCSVNLPSVCVWVCLGLQARRWLSNGSRLRIFNATMAALLLASLYPILRGK